MVLFIGSLFSLIVYLAAYVFIGTSLFYLNFARLDICLFLTLSSLASAFLSTLSTSFSLLLCPGCRMNLKSGLRVQIEISEETLARSKKSCVITRREMQQLEEYGNRYRDREGGSEKCRQVGMNFSIRWKIGGKLILNLREIYTNHFWKTEIFNCLSYLQSALKTPRFWMIEMEV